MLATLLREPTLKGSISTECVTHSTHYVTNMRTGRAHLVQAAPRCALPAAVRLEDGVHQICD